MREWLGEGIFTIRHGDPTKVEEQGEHDKWVFQRKVAAGIFTRGAFKGNMRDVFVRKGRAMCEAVRTRSGTAAGRGGAEGGAVDMQSVFFAFTMDSIMEIFFGRVADTIRGKKDEYAVQVR